MASEKKTCIPFNKQEMDMVTKLIIPHAGTLLDTRNTPEAIEAKRLAWAQVTEEFNNWPEALCFRSTKSLQTMWLKVKSIEKARLRRLAAQGYTEAILKVQKFNDPTVPSVPIARKKPKKASKKSSRKAPVRERSRKPNYTPNETKLLIRIIRPHVKIVDNKNTSTAINLKKRVTWQKIADEFNNESKALFTRSWTDLLSFWRKFKFETRKKHSGKTEIELSDVSDNDVVDTYFDMPIPRRGQMIIEPEDRTQLMRIVRPYYKLLENKSSQTSVLVRKKDAWKKIRIQYNNVCQTQRNKRELVRCWNKYKHEFDSYQDLESPDEARIPSPVFMGSSSRPLKSHRRRPNYTPHENKVLFRAIRPHLKDVENKSCLEADLIKKRIAWQKIAKNYNNLCKTHRSTAELIQRWRSVKHMRKSEKLKTDNTDIALDRILSGHEDAESLTPGFAEDLADLLPPIDSITTNEQLFGANLPNFPKSSTHTHESAATTSVLKKENQATTSAVPVILNSFVSGSDAPSVRAFLRNEMINEADSFVREDRSFVHTPLLLNKFEEYIDAKITLQQTRLEILREKARLQEEREQEGYDYRKTLKDQFFRQLTEQEAEIHELTLVNLRYDLLQMGKDFV